MSDHGREGLSLKTLVVVTIVMAASLPCRGQDGSTSASRTAPFVATPLSVLTWNSGEYLYDGDANVTQIGTLSSPNSDGKQSLFIYDSGSRLVQATIGRAAGDQIESYQYDALGNIQKRFVNGGEIGIGATSTATNRMDMRRYDDVGNVIGVAGDAFTIYTYDPLNRMTEKSWDSLSSEMYIYTPGEERVAVAQTSGTVTQWTWTIRDFDGQPLRQFSSGAGGWKWLEDTVWREGKLAGAERAPEGGGRRHYHLDHLGSPRLVTGSGRTVLARHDYAPYGIELTSIQQDRDREGRLKFTGHERDYLPIPGENVSYLDYMHARYYAAAVGRFQSMDAHLDSTRASHAPQTWNRYTYAAGNPIKFADRDGQDWALVYGKRLDVYPGDVVVLQRKRDPGTAVHVVMIGGFSPAKGSDLPHAQVWEAAPATPLLSGVHGIMESGKHKPALVDSNDPSAGGGIWSVRTSEVMGDVIPNRLQTGFLNSRPFTTTEVFRQWDSIGLIQYSSGALPRTPDASPRQSFGPKCDCASAIGEVLGRLHGTLEGTESDGTPFTITEWGNYAIWFERGFW